MANIVKAYRTYLLSKASVTSLVSTRIFFGDAPENPVYPLIVLTLTIAESERHLGNAAALGRTEIQADCYSKTHLEADNIGEQLRLVTEHFTGTWGTETIRTAYVTDRRDLNVRRSDAAQLYRHIRTIDVAVWHVEALPT